MRPNSAIFLLILQLILILCTTLINGYVIKRFADFNELLRLLNSVDELSPLPLVITEPTVDDDTESMTTKRMQSRRSVPTDEELRAALARLRNSEAGQQMPKTYTKKSQQVGYKTLKKFNNAGGSRNCFFSPVQCLVQFDLNKYKKLVDTSGMRRFGESS